MDGTGRRWRVLAAIPSAALVGVIATWAVGSGTASPTSSSGRVHHPAVHAASVMTRPVPVPVTRVPVESILTPAAGSDLGVYGTPDAAAPTLTLPAADELGSPLALLGVARQGGWFEALLPSRPNSSTAWVRATDVTVSTPTYRVEVSRAAHQLQLIRTSDGAVVLTSAVGVGAPATPTPAGTFFVRDLFPTHSTDHPYGPFAFGLSGHSDVLTHFGTGDGRIAIHGTNEPTSIGADLSNGCVHVPNAVDTALIPYLSLGTPVTIS